MHGVLELRPKVSESEIFRFSCFGTRVCRTTLKWSNCSRQGKSRGGVVCGVLCRMQVVHGGLELLLKVLKTNIFRIWVYHTSLRERLLYELRWYGTGVSQNTDF